MHLLRHHGIDVHNKKSAKPKSLKTAETVAASSASVRPQTISINDAFNKMVKWSASHPKAQQLTESIGHFISEDLRLLVRYDFTHPWSI